MWNMCFIISRLQRNCKTSFAVYSLAFSTGPRVVVIRVILASQPSLASSQRGWSDAQPIDGPVVCGCLFTEQTIGWSDLQMMRVESICQSVMTCRAAFVRRGWERVLALSADTCACGVQTLDFGASNATVHPHITKCNANTPIAGVI